MLFNSPEFLFVFLPLALAGFFLLGRVSTGLARSWLLLISVAFYGYWEYRSVPLLLVSISINFLIGKRLQATSGTRLPWLWLGIAFNLLLLGVFKYAAFLANNFNLLFNAHLPVPSLPLPLGISFFTFTQIAFLVDAWRREASEYRYGNYGIFVTFFPHLLAGPILHHKDMMPQVASPAVATFNRPWFSAGLFLFGIGLAKKVLIADQVAPWANAGFAAATGLSFIDAWIGALAYTVQIYFDFSGYSDMAVGLGLMFNIRLPVNFNSPYQATSVRDFWRRWHITLSSFLRDYLYIALGGNRRGWWLAGLFVVITFGLGGLWHGANWTFVVWGLINGLAVFLARVTDRLGLRTNRLVARWLTFIFVVVSWVMFRSSNLADAGHIIGAMMGSGGLSMTPTVPAWAALFDAATYQSANLHLLYPPLYTAVVLLLALNLSWFGRNSQDWLEMRALDLRAAAVVGILLGISVLMMNRGTEFLYFNF